jgi:hypothetical protein
MIYQAVKDFMSNRECRDYLKALEDSFMCYIKSDEYVCLGKEERVSYVSSYEELKAHIIRLIEITAISNAAEIVQSEVCNSKAVTKCA